MKVYYEIPGCAIIVEQFKTFFDEYSLQLTKKEKITDAVKIFFNDIKENLSSCEQRIKKQEIYVESNELESLTESINYYSGFARLSDDEVNEVFTKIDSLRTYIAIPK